MKRTEEQDKKNSETRELWLDIGEDTTDEKPQDTSEEEEEKEDDDN